MTSHRPADASNGYEAVAGAFMSHRSGSSIGVATVRRWTEELPPAAAVLDLGCGHGVPISRVLVDRGLSVYGIDASPSMIDRFRAHFPGAVAECAGVESSEFFGRAFDGVIAWGLMFLLSPEVQVTLVQKVSRALKPGGRFLFTAPRQASEWRDILTGRKSVSLGSETYTRLVQKSGLVVLEEDEDEGENHYYFVRRPRSGHE